MPLGTEVGLRPGDIAVVGGWNYRQQDGAPVVCAADAVHHFTVLDGFQNGL